MLLPVPDIFLETEATNICTEIQELEDKLVKLQQQEVVETQACNHLNKAIDTLKIQIPQTELQASIYVESDEKMATASPDFDERSKEILQYQNKIELKRSEAAHAKENIAAQHAQQATLDDLALRFETDCLKAEDRLEELQNLEFTINNEYSNWNMTEIERKEAIERAVKDEKIQTQEMAELYRQLEVSSMETAAASQACTIQKSNVETINAQVENIKKALCAAQEEAAALRRRLDETELALAERTAALKMEARSANIADEELLKVIKQVENAKEGLNDEISTGKELSLVAADAQKKREDAEKRANTAQKALEDAKKNHKLSEIDLRRMKAGAKQAEAAVQGALAQAGHSARSLAENLQKHRELEEAIKVQENAESSSKQQYTTITSLVLAQKQQNKALDEKISELSKQKLRLLHQSEGVHGKYCDREIALSNTQAQSKTLDARADKLQEQMQKQEEALYRVDFQLLLAKRAAALAKTESAGTTNIGAGSGTRNNDSPESLRLLKQELQNDLENARIAQRKQVRNVWEVESAAQQVGAAAQGLEQEMNKISEQQKIEDVALKTAQSSLQDCIPRKEDVQIAVDRASLSLSRSQERFKDKAKAVLQLSAAVEEGETSFKTRQTELENQLQQLSTDHHAAVNALQASKSELAAHSVAVSTATETLKTLQLKTGHQQQIATAAAKNKDETRNVTNACAPGGVADVCAEMQRQVQELQAALAAAEADCDVLEHALSAQKTATATANLQLSSS